MFRGDFALIRDSSNEKSGIMDILPAMLIFTAIGMIVTLLAAFLLAVLISSGAIPEGARNITALCCVPGTFVTGLLTARRAGRRILPMGLISGGLFLVLLLLISVIFCRGLTPGADFSVYLPPVWAEAWPVRFARLA